MGVTTAAPALGVPISAAPAAQPYPQPVMGVMSSEPGAPAVLGRTPDGRTIITLPLRLFREGGDARFPDNYTQMLQGRLPYNVYRDILDTLNAAASKFHQPNPAIITPAALLTVGLAVWFLGPYYMNQQKKMFRALDDAVSELNRRYGATGVSLRRNVAASEPPVVYYDNGMMYASRGRRTRYSHYRGMPNWQADLEVVCNA